MHVNMRILFIQYILNDNLYILFSLKNSIYCIIEENVFFKIFSLIFHININEIFCIVVE